MRLRGYGFKHLKRLVKTGKIVTEQEHSIIVSFLFRSSTAAFVRSLSSRSERTSRTACGCYGMETLDFQPLRGEGACRPSAVRADIGVDEPVERSRMLAHHEVSGPVEDADLSVALLLHEQLDQLHAVVEGGGWIVVAPDHQ